MLLKQLTFVIICALFLSIVGGVAAPEVKAQIACTVDTDCAGGLSCVSGICNVLPPIWNVAGNASFSNTGQNAQIFLQGADTNNSARFGTLQIGFGNQMNNLASCGTDQAPVNCEVSVNYSSPGGARVGRGFTVYNGDDTPWFRVDRNGNITISNNLLVNGTIQGNFVATGGRACTANQVLRRNAANTAWECVALTGGTGGCNGAVYQGPSGTGRNGSRGGYVNANTECNVAFSGSHVCKTSEILESTNCGAFAGKNTNGGVPMWINNLAPSLPTPTNDCGGWQTAAAGSVGVIYTYVATGGTGGTATCDSVLRFACCL